jgi:hypothetical protein
VCGAAPKFKKDRKRMSKHYIEGKKLSLWGKASQEETEKIIEKISKVVVERELDFPAILLLGGIRPLAPIGGPMLRVFLAPWTPFLGDLPYEYISVLEDPDNMKKLINKITEVIEEREEEKKKKKEEKKSEENKKKKLFYPFFRRIKELIYDNREEE